MPYKLENQEIYWEVCLSHCPKSAIQKDASGHYLINQRLCHSCFYGKLPQFIQQHECGHSLHS